jgi:hypothetical protein
MDVAGNDANDAAARAFPTDGSATNRAGDAEERNVGRPSHTSGGSSGTASTSSNDASGGVASAAFVTGLATLVDREGVAAMRETQLQTLSSLQDSNAMLGSFNDLCDAQLPATARDLARSAAVVRAIREDLAYIHTHSMRLKARIKAAYPDAFEGLQEYHVPEDLPPPA